MLGYFPCSPGFLIGVNNDIIKRPCIEDFGNQLYSMSEGIRLQNRSDLALGVFILDVVIVANKRFMTYFNYVLELESGAFFGLHHYSQ